MSVISRNSDQMQLVKCASCGQLHSVFSCSRRQSKFVLCGKINHLQLVCRSREVCRTNVDLCLNQDAINAGLFAVVLFVLYDKSAHLMEGLSTDPGIYCHSKSTISRSFSQALSHPKMSRELYVHMHIDADYTCAHLFDNHQIYMGKCMSHWNLVASGVCVETLRRGVHRGTTAVSRS